MHKGFLTLGALYIGFCYPAALGLLPSPSQPRCVFIFYDQVTCYWMPGKNSPSDTIYTLQANMTSGPNCDFFFRQSFSCWNVTQTNCSAPIGTTDRQFSIRVVAHSSTATASSPTLCINATDAVKLRTPSLSNLRPKGDSPECLELQWHKPTDFAASHDAICSGSVIYELQYSTDDESEPLTEVRHVGQNIPYSECNSSLKKPQGMLSLRGLCLFKPFTHYTIRMRQCTSRSMIWSDWSKQLHSCTGIAAPVTAPQFWRTIMLTDFHQRQVTLLWKSPPRSQTACTSLWFNVSCRVESSHHALHTRSCQTLSVTDISCQLTLPIERCSCSLTMVNSAGPSLPARITLPGPADTVPKALEKVSITALDDSRLDVRWTSVKHPPLTGFLVEWVSASETANPNLHWERLGHETSSMNITDLLPKVCYNVSVRPEFGPDSGEPISTQHYTRQGVPSTGPKLYVQEQSSSSVLLVWEPLPVEQQHGVITQYSLYCQREDNTTCGVHTVSRERLYYRLTGLSGVYKIYMTAHTVAGEGRVGPALWVTVEGTYAVRTILYCSIPPVLTLLMLLILIPWRQRIRKNIWPHVPDPALSSLTAWVSKTEHTKKHFYSGGLEHTSTCRLADTLHREEYG